MSTTGMLDSCANGLVIDHDHIVNVFTSNIRVSAKTSVPVFNWERGLIDSLADACMLEQPMAAAASLSQRFAKTPGCAQPQCIYVITTPNMPVCKVGIAADPLGRLCNLQIGNWNELTIAGLLWVPGIGTAAKIEQLTHKAAKEMRVELRGEWLALKPRDAMLLVIKAARHAKAGVAPSYQYLEGIASRTAAIGAATGYGA